MDTHNPQVSKGIKEPSDSLAFLDTFKHLKDVWLFTATPDPDQS